ncbi:ABC transporter ATP-binding protein (plasmid) [Paraburkholderia sp. PREW-6R]|uniref:ABC transporter ATP-binding protein n=1 Tax=Paraburkholderia sp. PREW-6R TaxID=3141544 RepID=UPI0031F4D3B4
MLRLEKLSSRHGRVTVLKQVDMTIARGEIVALIGANGAGKTTLLHTVSGVHPSSGGQIFLNDQPISEVKAHLRVGLGIAQSPEGRQVFKPLTVENNLRLGAYRRRDSRAAIERDLDEIYALFPVLAQMRKRVASALSGGQQQMLAIGRALLSKPHMLLLDEPSLGLAPLIVDQILDVLVRLKAQGMTILLVEQNAVAALAIADRGYVLETGSIVGSGTGKALMSDPAVREAYLGV